MPSLLPLLCRALRATAKPAWDKLIRLGYGVYARAELSKLTGRPMLATDGGFLGAVARQLA